MLYSRSRANINILIQTVTSFVHDCFSVCRNTSCSQKHIFWGWNKQCIFSSSNIIYIDKKNSWETTSNICINTNILNIFHFNTKENILGVICCKRLINEYVKENFFLKSQILMQKLIILPSIQNVICLKSLLFSFLIFYGTSIF